MLRLAIAADGVGNLNFAEAVFKSRRVTVGEEAGLFNPVVAADTALKLAKLGVDPVDIGIVPCSNLGIPGNPQGLQDLRNFWT